MTREDIIRMAREAGWIIRDDLHYMDHQAMQDALIERIERFAALVSAAERQKVRSSMKKAFRRMAGLIRADEREACARVCADLHIEGEDNTGLAADLIRARGQA